MKYKKIRGHKRRHKQIEKWRIHNTSLNIKDYLLHTWDTHYVRIRIYPWNGFTHSKINSAVPEPKGKTKQLFLNALLDIYADWKNELKKLEQPYYLKIWLYESNFSKSEVVCGIGEKIEFYENSFNRAEDSPVINLNNYGAAKGKMSNLNWVQHLDEEHYENNFIGEAHEYISETEYLESEIWFSRLLKKPHTVTMLDEPVRGAFEIYSFTKGNVWIGGE
jgi:hypothetical protein